MRLEDYDERREDDEFSHMGIHSGIWLFYGFGQPLERRLDIKYLPADAQFQHAAVSF